MACDVSIGSSNAIFKAKAFKALAGRERRFADMLRLVKAWAGAHGLNDAAEGTFNSFALGLMVILLTHMKPDHKPDLASGAYHEASFPTHMQPDN